MANCFDSSDWFDIYIRRQDNINKSLLQELKAKDRDQAFEEGYSVPEMINSLYLDNLRPIYLIFDQFEELFILGEEDAREEEQKTFIGHIKSILEAELPCKLIFVIREEYLAHLSNFEREIPSLFDKRLRVEPMTRFNAGKVILNTARNDQFKIQLDPPDVAEKIIEKVTEGKGRVQLTYLQVFLDKMYRVAYDEGTGKVVFNHQLVEELGQIDDVLADFLDEQLEHFAKEVAPREEALQWLKVFVSDKGTKNPIKREELPEKLQHMSREKISKFLAFFVNRRILRPLDNDQYELSHDSLAARIFKSRPIGVAMPQELPGFDLPENPFLRFRPFPKEMGGVAIRAG